ncbi:MAG: ATP-binding protein [Oscillospiraceae bacterium]
MNFPLSWSRQVRRLCFTHLMSFGYRVIPENWHVFNNILRNAVTYSYPNSIIQIMISKSDTQIEVSVQNAGKTIPADRLKTIFPKLTRLDDARGSDTDAAGLGLAIAQEIVLLHGGSITATSRDEMVTFLVTLPKLHV